MDKKIFIKTGTVVRQNDANIIIHNTLPVGVYEVQQSMEGMFLNQIGEKFNFPYKIYDLQNDFINYIIKSFNNTNTNLGVLLSGVKGSGKTVIAKQLCNQLNLPVIIIRNSNDEILDFVSTLANDCIIFLDEYEKIFDEEDGYILSIMDGVYTNYRRLFLLTTNDLSINENLINRPSRIRYVKEFKNLDLNIIKEYIKDNLIQLEYTDQVVNYLDTLEISTIDIVKTIIEDINIHGFETFKENSINFNVKKSEYRYYGYCWRHNRLKKLNEEELKNNVNIFIKEISHMLNSGSKNICEDSDLFEKIYYTQSFYSDIKFNNLKINNIFDNDDENRIIYIDINNNVIVTEDLSLCRYKYYYIINPNENASLFNPLAY
jgi:hypothetical protein